MRARVMSVRMTSNSLWPSVPACPILMSFSDSAMGRVASAFRIVPTRSPESVRPSSTDLYNAAASDSRPVRAKASATTHSSSISPVPPARPLSPASCATSTHFPRAGAIEYRRTDFLGLDLLHEIVRGLPTGLLRLPFGDRLVATGRDRRPHRDPTKEPRRARSIDWSTGPPAASIRDEAVRAGGSPSRRDRRGSGARIRATRSRRPARRTRNRSSPGARRRSWH